MLTATIGQEPPLKTVDILGIQVGCVRLDDILVRVRAWVLSEERRSVFYVNAHCLNMANADRSYRTILNAGDLVYADGIGAVWASRLLGGCQMQKATGADWIADFCRAAEIHAWRVYLVAGAPGVAKTASAQLRKAHSKLNIVGVADGFFSEKRLESVLHEIKVLSPHVVFVGMGTPRQEQWIAGHRHEIEAPVCWAVGALFDYVAGVEQRAPTWMRALALEWFWRLLVDPVGKWRRYLWGTPLFMYYVLRQKLITLIKTTNAPTT